MKRCLLRTRKDGRGRLCAEDGLDRLVSVVLGCGLVAPVWTEEAMTSDERSIRSLEEQEAVAVLKQDVAARVFWIA